MERRQKLVLRKAINSTAIVSSLFPERVHDRLLETAIVNTTSKAASATMDSLKGDQGDGGSSDSSYASEHIDSVKVKEPTKMRLKNFLRDNTPETKIGGGSLSGETKPIADFFPNCTVMVSRRQPRVRKVDP